MTNDGYVGGLPERYIPPEPRFQEQPRALRWPVWLVVLAICAAPFTIPLGAGILAVLAGLAVGAIALLAGLALGVVTLLGGIGAGGVICILGGVAGSLWGLWNLVTLDLGRAHYYLGSGAVASLVGALMLAICAGTVYLAVRAFAWLRGRRGGN